jgi:3-dehydroquinate synthase class II
MDEKKHITEEEVGWVLQNLERDQLVQEKSAPVPRRQLRGGESVLVWALRIYLIFMMAVVFWQAWAAVR